MMAVVTAVLLLVCLWNVSLAEEYVNITRNYEGDVFKIPRSMCQSAGNIEQLCNKMDAKQKRITRRGTTRLVRCKCQCNVNDHNVFGYFDNTGWKCESNSDVRTQHADCSVINFDGQSTYQSLELVDFNTASTVIGDLQIQGESYCTLREQFSYLDCYGNWRPMNNTGAGFTLYRYIDNSQTVFGISHKDKAAFKDYKPKIYGHIIKLNIWCGPSSQTNYGCVLLGVKGKLTCPIVRPTTSLVTSSSTSSSHSPLTTSTLETSTVTPEIPPTTTSSIQSTLSPSSVPHTTLSVPTTDPPSIEVITESTKSPNKTTEPFLKDGDKSASTADNTSIIAGTVGGVVALLVIIVIVIVSRKIKRKRNTAADRGPQKHDNVYEQPVDNQLTHTDQQSSMEDEYDYTYSSSLPTAERKNDIATRRISGSNNQAYGHSLPDSDAPVYNTLEDPDSMNSEPVYNVLEGPKTDQRAGHGQGSLYNVLERPVHGGAYGHSFPVFDAPVYNTLEDPDSMNSEPVYNVLEGPETDQSAGHGQGPLYDVLEGPVHGGAPVYDVLEGPESDEQHVYGSLEGQDPHLYGSLNDPHTSNDVDPSSKGGIYQQLNQASRQSSGSEYQPLSYPHVSMKMNNLNDGSPQSCA